MAAARPDVHPSERDSHVLYGLSCSYFTGKLQAYLQTKGLPHRFVEMDRARFLACARATGIVQLPCVEAPDGTWLTDTTAILDHFETARLGPRVRPDDPATAFCSLLLEDLFDEWFWRPALYYRWAFAEDARLMSRQIARTLLRDVPLPLFLRRLFILHRQRIVYLKKDGVTAQTAPAIEALYLDALRELDRVFARRPFLLGNRPCEADFGLFGPFFRHFFCDPTPGALMRERAPHVAHWVTRLWKTRPPDLEGRAAVTRVPDDLGFFFEMAANDYLPYLEANSRAVASKAKSVRYRAQGVDWEIPAAPYRVECFDQLKRRFAALDPGAAGRVAGLLPAGGSSGWAGRSSGRRPGRMNGVCAAAWGARHPCSTDEQPAWRSVDDGPEPGSSEEGDARRGVHPPLRHRRTSGGGRRALRARSATRASTSCASSPAPATYRGTSRRSRSRPSASWRRSSRTPPEVDPQPGPLRRLCVSNILPH